LEVTNRPVGETVKLLRALRGFSQKGLAHAAKTAETTVVDVELERKLPRPSTVRKIAEALGVRTELLYLDPQEAEEALLGPLGQGQPPPPTGSEKDAAAAFRAEWGKWRKKIAATRDRWDAASQRIMDLADPGTGAPTTDSFRLAREWANSVHDDAAACFGLYFIPRAREALPVDEGQVYVDAIANAARELREAELRAEHAAETVGLLADVTAEELAQEAAEEYGAVQDEAA
jgi:transcriptional regulator with XRE-family HTH domain